MSEAVLGYIFIVTGGISATFSIFSVIAAFIIIAKSKPDGKSESLGNAIICAGLSLFFAVLAWWLISTGLTGVA